MGEYKLATWLTEQKIRYRWAIRAGLLVFALILSQAGCVANPNWQPPEPPIVIKPDYTPPAIIFDPNRKWPIQINSGYEPRFRLLPEPIVIVTAENTPTRTRTSTPTLVQRETPTPTATRISGGGGLELPANTGPALGLFCGGAIFGALATAFAFRRRS